MARRARPPSAARRFGTAARGAAEAGYLAGQLLVAMPTMQDPRFARTVICLCAHSPEGAMGIVLNKPLDGLSFDDLLQQLGLDPTPPQRRIRLVAGGPVEGGRGFVLHTADWETEGSLRVNPQIALTASVDILKAIAGGGGPREGFLALGYAGWGPGQLESEIHQNAWLSVPADEGLLFSSQPDRLWRQALGKLHVDPGALSGIAGRA
jgi:putative transcriptional regulator